MKLISLLRQFYWSLMSKNCLSLLTSGSPFVNVFFSVASCQSNSVAIFLKITMHPASLRGYERSSVKKQYFILFAFFSECLTFHIYSLGAFFFLNKHM